MMTVYLLFLNLDSWLAGGRTGVLVHSDSRKETGLKQLAKRSSKAVKTLFFNTGFGVVQPFTDASAASRHRSAVSKVIKACTALGFFSLKLLKADLNVPV